MAIATNQISTIQSRTIPLTTVQLTGYTAFVKDTLIWDTTAKILYHVDAVGNPNTFANATLSPISSGSPYVDSRAANALLTVNSCHIVQANDHRLPAAPALGDWVKVYNLAQISQVVPPNRAQTNGNGNNFAEGNSWPVALTSPTADIPPDAEFTYVFDGTNWRVESDILRSVDLVGGVHSGLILRGGVEYTITNSTVGAVLRLTAIPAGVVKVRLGSTSTEPVTIEQFDTGATPILLREDGTVTTTFELPLANAPEQVNIDGPTGSSLWRVYRPWVLRPDTLSELTDTDLTTAPPADCQALIYNNATGNWVPSPGVPVLDMGPVADFATATATPNLKPGMKFWIEDAANSSGPPGAYRSIISITAGVARWSGPYGAVISGAFDSTVVTIDSSTLTWDSTIS